MRTKCIRIASCFPGTIDKGKKNQKKQKTKEKKKEIRYKKRKQRLKDR